jgi:hypothetical protein
MPFDPEPFLQALLESAAIRTDSLLRRLKGRSDLTAKAARMQVGVLEGLLHILPEVMRDAKRKGVAPVFARAAIWMVLQALRRARWLAGVGGDQEFMRAGHSPVYFESPEFQILVDQRVWRKVSAVYQRHAAKMRFWQLISGLRRYGCQTLKLDGLSRHPLVFGRVWQATSKGGKKVNGLDDLEMWVERVRFETEWVDPPHFEDESGEGQGLLLRCTWARFDVEDLFDRLLEGAASTVIDLESGRVSAGRAGVRKYTRL